MNSFLFFLSFILLNPWVLCFLSQTLIPGKVGGSDFFYFLPLWLSFFRLSPVINNFFALRSVHFVSLFACLRIVPAYFHVVRIAILVYPVSQFFKKKTEMKKDKPHLNEIYLFFRLSTAFCKSLRNRVPSSSRCFCGICI